jgi:Undecaprenyl-phosphate glucose phosphotransferase
MLIRLKSYRILLQASIYLTPFLAFEMGWLLWFSVSNWLNRPILFSHHGIFLRLLVAAFIWAFMASRYRVANLNELFIERTGARAAWSATLSTAVILIGILFFGRNEVLPRGLLLSGIVCLLALTLLIHAIFRALLRGKLKLGQPTRILIIGADEFAQNAATRLENVSFVPCEIVGYVQLPGQNTVITRGPLYGLEDLGTLHGGNGVDEAVLAIHPAQFSQIPAIIEALATVCVPARAIVDLGEGIVVREKLFQMGRMQMLDLTATPAESLDYTLLKRAFDIVFSVIAIVALSPLLLLIAICIRVTSGSPIIFKQKRVGLNGKLFDMYKFRTMKVMSALESDLGRTAKSDPRCTAIGAILRKSSLDELPQFFNILTGDMSVVGPRPEVPHFVQKYMEDVQGYNNRHWLKVGITGWAQVNGWRGETSIQKRIEHDLYYLQNWTLGLDLRIIFMTISSVLVGKNAY